jgi:hypothetical protein
LTAVIVIVLVSVFESMPEVSVTLNETVFGPTGLPAVCS